MVGSLAELAIDFICWGGRLTIFTLYVFVIICFNRMLVRRAILALHSVELFCLLQHPII